MFILDKILNIFNIYVVSRKYLKNSPYLFYKILDELMMYQLLFDLIIESNIRISENKSI